MDSKLNEKEEKLIKEIFDKIINCDLVCEGDRETGKDVGWNTTKVKEVFKQYINIED